jgi:hypothetical protein
MCSDEQRALTSSWCTPELLKALERGYKVVQIHEIHHFDRTTAYDRSTGENGLYTEYIKQFIRTKQEASDWPEHVTTEQEKDEYIQMYKEHEDVTLRRERIEHNPGLRSMAKMNLNCLWGRLSMGNDKAMTKILNNQNFAELYTLLADNNKEVVQFSIVNESIMLLRYRDKHGRDDDGRHSNVYLGCLTTCYARLALLDLMERVSPNVMYVDTDSVMYLSTPGCTELPTGCYLGQLTDELKPFERISEFVTTAPKTYAMYIKDIRDNSVRSVVKCKGFRLNHANEKVIHFESLLKLLEQYDDDDEYIKTVTPKRIYRSVAKKARVISGPEIKVMRRHIGKRWHDGQTNRTYPYGYKNP